MYSILIADDDRSWCEKLKKRLEEDDLFSLIAVEFDGKKTIDYIEKHRPDVILLDISIPNYDGGYIVRHIRKNYKDYRPYIYILSVIGTNTVVNVINQLDIDYFNLKPVEVEVVIQNLYQIVKHPSEFVSLPRPQTDANIDKTINDCLYNLGVPIHLLSTGQTIDAIKICLKDEAKLRLITKYLYQEVAEINKTKPSAIERNIRSSLTHMKKNKTPLFEKLFLYNSDEVANAEFLAIVVNYIKKL